MSILIYHYGALGDFITALPSFRFLKNRFSGTITLLGKPAFGTLALQAGYADTFLDADSSRFRFLFSPGKDSGALRAFSEQFTAVALFSDEDAPISVNTRKYFPGTQYCIPPIPAGKRPAADRFMDLFPMETVPFENIPKVSIRALSSEGKITATFIREQHPFMVIHPGSGSILKNWPFRNFIEVASLMKNKGYTVVWLSGPAERQTDIPVGAVHFNNLSLPDCCILLEHSSIYLGNDSGITHLAAATGTKVVALFGPSDSSIWAPRGTGSITVLHASPPAGCAPCHLRATDGRNCGHSCMTRIPVQEVVEALLS